MDEIKLLILLITLCLVILAEYFMTVFTNAKTLHLKIYSFLWASLLFISCFRDPILEISNFIFFIFCVAWALFYLGTFASFYFFYTSSPITPSSKNYYSSVNLKITLYVLITLSIISNILHYLAIASKLTNLETIAVLRSPEGLEAAEESSGIFFNIFGRIYSIFVPIAFLLYKRKSLSIFLLAIIVLVAFIIAGSAFTRSPIIFVFMLILGSIYVLRIKVNPLFAAIIIFMVIGFSYIITAEIAKLSGGEGSYEDFFATTKLYFIGSLKNYETLFKGLYIDRGIYDNSYYSLDFINYFFKKTGLISTYPSLIRNYPDNIESNVYTYLDAATLDFGWTGILISPIALGFFCGFIACKVTTSKNFTWLVLYCFCCHGIFFSFMGNEFIRNTAPVLVIICFILHYFNIKSTHRKRFLHNI